MWIEDQRQILELLFKWRGASGQVWEYTCGHGTLLVRLFRRDSKSSLFMQCKDCRTIKFPSIGWKDVNLALRQKQNPLQNDEDFKFEIQDGDTFYVACWAIYLLESEKFVYTDWPPKTRKISGDQLC